MRRYGYTFVKGSGADYKFSNIIEAIFFGEILLKTALFLSLLLIIGLYSLAVCQTIQFAISHKVGSIVFFNLGMQTLYFLLIAFVNVYLIRNTKKIQ